VLLTAFIAVAVAQPAMRLHFIDIGQGSAVLLDFPCGTALWDVGGEGNGDARASFQANAVLIPYLKQVLGDRKLDVLFLSHPHLDHVSGLDVLIASYPPRFVVDDGWLGHDGEMGEKGAADYIRDLRSWTESNSVPLRSVPLHEVPSSGGLTDEQIDPLDCVDITLSWGGVDRRGDAWDNDNNHSLVAKFVAGEASALFTGDLEYEGIAELLRRTDSENLDADVLQVGHHGSHNGTTEALLDAVSPQIAVIQMGPRHRHGLWTAYQFGHPRQPAIERLLSSVTGERPPIDAWVATAPKQFYETRIDKAIYATGWDGHVVVEATLEGVWTVTTAGRTPVE
jgi:competence protein ComEC